MRCLPPRVAVVVQAVEVDENNTGRRLHGEPVLRRLLDFCQDILIVEVKPLRRDEVPTRAADILDRLNETLSTRRWCRRSNVITRSTR